MAPIKNDILTNDTLPHIFTIILN